MSHPWLVSLYLARQGARGENAVRLGAVMDERLAAAGVAPDAAADARRVLLVHLMGSAAFAASGAGLDAGVDAAHARALFTRSLDWLLAGLVTPCLTRARQDPGIVQRPQPFSSARVGRARPLLQ